MTFSNVVECVHLGKIRFLIHDSGGGCVWKVSFVELFALIVSLVSTRDETHHFLQQDQKVGLEEEISGVNTSTIFLTEENGQLRTSRRDSAITYSATSH